MNLIGELKVVSTILTSLRASDL